VKEDNVMPEHLNQTQLEGYRNRTLALGELVAVDSHLSACGECRKTLAALAGKSASDSIISGIDQARFRHLSYEQMDDWVEDRLDPGGRELVMAHIGACPPCARQLIAYQEYAPKMAAPIQTMMMPATQTVAAKQPWWAFLKQPQYALGAAALVAFLVIASPWSRHEAPPVETGAIVTPASTGESTIPAQNSSLNNPLTEAALSTTELDSLPDNLRVGAKAVVTAPDTAPKPAALKGLDPKGDTTLEYPYAEVVAETLPVMRWKAFGDTYDVSLYDSRHSLISRRGGLKDTHWTPSSPLVRNQVYSWEVEAGGQKHRGTFRVLAEAQRQELEKVRAEHGNSHLVVGAVSEQLGLLTPARQEFEAMAKNSGQAQQAAKLLSHIDALRR
jgi:hypothetical protein